MMQIDFNSNTPIFQQIADGVESAILSGAFPEGSQIPSITEFSLLYKINPATALKGINLLVDQGILYKKRGVGMFVAEGAVSLLQDHHREEFFDRYVVSLLHEANRLGLTKEDVLAMIERGYEK